MRKSLHKMTTAMVLAFVLLVGCTAMGETNATNDRENSFGAAGGVSPEDEIESAVGNVNLPYYIKVDRKANCVTVYGMDSEGKHTIPVKYMVCSVGTDQNTPLGVFAISDQYRWRALFGGTYGQYASRITGNILFHSVPYLKEKEDTLVPGAYNQLGTKASQGCVRLCCSDAKWIYDHCAPGTVVEIFDGATSTVPEKPSALKIDPASPYCGWDPTDPSPDNPWKRVPVTIHGVKDLTVVCGTEADLLAGVFAIDIDGQSLLEVSLSGTLDLSQCGTYIVAYSAVGATGTTASIYATVTVVAC